MRRAARLLAAAWLAALPAAGDEGGAPEPAAPPRSAGTAGSHRSALPDEPRPLRPTPPRPRPLLEAGAPFLGTGVILPGFRLPTGAVWQPQAIVFGSYRSALQTFDDGSDRFTQWANRLDLFGNLAFTPTERLLVGFRPLDRDGRFTGYAFGDGPGRGGTEHWNASLRTLFFEGDFGELFPGLDRHDRRALDIGFAAGRQPLAFQDGILINDVVDAVGITRNSLRPEGVSNLRATAVYGFGDVHRDDLRDDSRASFLGLFTETDLRHSTVGFDLVYLHDPDDGEDAFFTGLSSVQRLGLASVTLRALASLPVRHETPQTGRGLLAMSELSWSHGASEDLVYLSAFAALGRFSSVARDPLADGPLGNSGILFAGVGLGRYGAVLDSRAEDAVGASLGHQWFFAHGRRQVVLELSGRHPTRDGGVAAAALGARVQQALGRRIVIRADGYLAAIEGRASRLGARTELLVKF